MNTPYEFANGNIGLGYSTNSSSYSDNMVDMDVFGRVTAPLIPQPTFGYSQAQTYTHAPQPPTQEAALRERCKMLEVQLLKTTTERDTLRTMLQQLSQSNCLSTPTPKTVNEKLRFWSQIDYNKWTNTAAAIANPRWKVAFIEDEEGNPASEETVKAIRKTVRACWAELVDKAMAPRSWGKASASAKQLVRSHTYHDFPIMQLGENDWKIELLCSIDYPGFVRNKLDDKGNWIINEETGRKRKPKAIKSEVSEKKPKISDNENTHPELFPASSIVSPDFFNSLSVPGDVELPLPSSPSSPVEKPEPVSPTDSLVPSPLLPTTTPPSAQAPPLVSTPLMLGGLLDSRVTTPEVRTPNAGTDDTAPMLGGLLDSHVTTPEVRTPNMGTDDTAPILRGLSNSRVTTPEVRTPNVGIDDTAPILRGLSDSPVTTPEVRTPNVGTDDTAPCLGDPATPGPTGKSEGTTPTDIPEPSLPPVVVNPLANLVKKSVTLKLPPLPPVPESKKNKPESGGKGAQANGTTRRGKKKASTHRKMRPTKAKSGYNLCAWRWLVQVNTNGSCDEFIEYWDGLNKGQRDAYINETKEMVDTNTWDPAVVSKGAGTMY